MYINQFNKHWEEGFFYNIKFKRNYFKTLKEQLENKFITKIVGLRRVGKTTLMRQLIDYLVQEKSVPRKNIFFYSFDEIVDIDELIKEYVKIADIDLNNDKLYIFFDEIQKVKDFQSKIKIYYDLYPNIKFILSGSSSLYLQKRESLAGRITEIYIKTLFFDEYLRYKKLDYFLENPLMYKDKLISEFEKYLFRQFIDTIFMEDYQIFDYVNALLSKVIKEDISSYFKVDYPDILLKIFKIISQTPGMLLDYKNFANDLDIDQRTLEKYIYYLQEAFLLKKVYNYSKNLIKSERKLKKVYLESTSFCIGSQITGELFENYVLNVLDLEYFARFGNKEVDFLKINDKFNLNPKITGIEVKYKSKLKKEDTKGLIYLDKKVGFDKKIIITKDIDGKIDDIELIPFWKIER